MVALTFAPSAVSGLQLRQSQRPAGALRSRPARLAVPAVRATAAVEAEVSAAPGIEKTSTSFKAVMDIEKIKSVLPHRYPFLLVDRVVELEPQTYGVGYKNVTTGDEFFNGHFPERAIMPGVLQVEAMAQLGGLIMLNPDDQEAKEQFFFGGIDSCKFRKPVVPGDTLMMRVEVTKYNKRFGIVKMAGKAYVGEDLVCEVNMTLAMGK